MELLEVVELELWQKIFDSCKDNRNNLTEIVTSVLQNLQEAGRFEDYKQVIRSNKNYIENCFIVNTLCSDRESVKCFVMAYGREEVKKVLPTIFSSGISIKLLVKIMMDLWDSGHYNFIEYIIKTDLPIKTALLLEIMINLLECAPDDMINYVFSAGYIMPLSQKTILEKVFYLR